MQAFIALITSALEAGLPYAKAGFGLIQGFTTLAHYPIAITAKSTLVVLSVFIVTLLRR